MVDSFYSLIFFSQLGSLDDSISFASSESSVGSQREINFNIESLLQTRQTKIDHRSFVDFIADTERKTHTIKEKIRKALLNDSIKNRFWPHQHANNSCAKNPGDANGEAEALLKNSWCQYSSSQGIFFSSSDRLIYVHSAFGIRKGKAPLSDS